MNNDAKTHKLFPHILLPQQPTVIPECSGITIDIAVHLHKPKQRLKPNYLSLFIQHLASISDN